jgi:hypothetical protein
MLEQLCANFALKVADYRNGEIPPIDTKHIYKWLDQFDEPKRIPILTEMTHLIDKIYLSEKMVQNFLEKNIDNPKLVGTDVISYWNNINVLDIQQGGTSQSSMKALLSSILSSKYRINLYNAGSNNGIYIYLDDVCFSGNRVINDVRLWLEQTKNITINKLIIHTIAIHSNGRWYADREIKKIMQQFNQNFPVEWWTTCTLENNLHNIEKSDIFAPRSLPHDPYVQQYVDYLTQNGFPPALRKILSNQQQPKIFSDEENRNFLEQEFLQKSCYIRHICSALPEQIRPLGFSLMKTLGFGSPIITYRNCPNTSPLVLWVGDPWYPLFPRRVN